MGQCFVPMSTRSWRPRSSQATWWWWTCLATHKVDDIRGTIEARGAALMYLPQYSPDYSPIEPC